MVFSFIAVGMVAVHHLAVGLVAQMDYTLAAVPRVAAGAGRPGTGVAGLGVDIPDRVAKI